MDISIYKIYSSKHEKCYVGSTKTPLNRRYNYHRQNYKKYCEGKNTYCSSYEIIDKDWNCQIELLEVCKPENRTERERHWIRTLDTVNLRRIKNAEERRQQKREYRAKKKLMASLASPDQVSLQ